MASNPFIDILQTDTDRRRTNTFWWQRLSCPFYLFNLFFLFVLSVLAFLSGKPDLFSRE